MRKIIDTTTLYFQKLLTLLHVGSVPCGLEITDQVVRLAYFDNNTWQLTAVRLEPGVVEHGKVKDVKRFVEYLAALKAKIPGAEGRDKKIDVTVVMGEAAIYNKIFSLPLVEGKNLQDAVTLNMQMASPVELSQGYSGWQIAGRDEKASRIDVLGTFADRAMVDEVSAALFEVGFVSLVIESKALAIARMFRNHAVGMDPNASYVIVTIDDANIDFLIIRAGQLYFEYANAWSDLADEKGAITVPKFKEILGASLRQVSIFYGSHWNDKIAGVIVSAAMLENEAQEAVREVLDLPVTPLSTVIVSQVAAEWMAVVGAGFRSMDPKKESDGINLLGEGAEREFRDDRILRFAAFWRFLIPTAAVLLVASFVVADFFLINVKNSVKPLSINVASGNENQEIATLTASATTFNRSVSLIQSIETTAQPVYAIIQDITGSADANNIILTKFSFSGMTEPVLLAGQAESQDQILAFETALKADSRVNSVDLPLSAIQNTGSNYAFSMTVTLVPVVDTTR